MPKEPPPVRELTKEKITIIQTIQNAKRTVTCKRINKGKGKTS